MGEAPKAVIVLKKDTKISEDDIREFFHPKVAPHKHLVGGIKFVDELPKTGSGKVMRRALRNL